MEGEKAKFIASKSSLDIELALTFIKTFLENFNSSEHLAKDC